MTSKVDPLFGKMERPGNIKGDQTDKERGVLGTAIGIVRGLIQLNRSQQGADGLVNKNYRNEEFKNLTRKGRDLPNQAYQANHGGKYVHEPCPDADPEKERKVFGVELFREPVRCAEKNGDGSGNAHEDNWLARKNGVNNADKGT